MNPKFILAIESSCDDCAVAILDDKGRVLADLVHSQIAPHAPYGGVVPEIASRRHLVLIAEMVGDALNAAKIAPHDLSAVCVTKGPGLIGSLLVGAQFAKGFAGALEVQPIGVHHIEGHVFAGYLEDGFPEAPFVALIVSGGHSSLYLSHLDGRIELLGETLDDAAGEAFDKIGRMLGLPYPAGKAIDELAFHGDAGRFAFPIALRSKDTLDFSFSGLKTSARLRLEALREKGPVEGQLLFDFCASFRKAIVDALLAKAMLACKQRDVRSLVLGGGVAANSLLREEAKRRGALDDVAVYLPLKEHCTDNAVMIGKAALRRMKMGSEVGGNFKVTSTLEIA